MVSETREFENYDAARAYIAERPGENLTIVSDSHLRSPLELPALDNFTQIYRSAASGNQVAIFHLND